MTVIGHVGNLLTSLIYLAPVAVVMGVLVVMGIRDRRSAGVRERVTPNEGDEP